MFLKGNHHEVQSALKVLDQLSFQVLMIEQKPTSQTVGAAYYVIDQLELLSVSILDDRQLSHRSLADLIMNNAATMYLQLVLLTLLLVNEGQEFDLAKMMVAIEKDYPVANLDSRFNFRNEHLQLQRLRLMDSLKSIISPKSLWPEFKGYTLERLAAWMKG